MPRVIPQLSGMLKPVMCQRRGLRPSLPDSSTWIQTASLDSHISGEPNEVCSTSAGETGSGCTLITIETVHLNFRRQKGKLPESERCIDSYSTIIKICALFLESENWRNYHYFVVSNFKQWDREKKQSPFAIGVRSSFDISTGQCDSARTQGSLCMPMSVNSKFKTILISTFFFFLSAYSRHDGSGGLIQKNYFWPK